MSRYIGFRKEGEYGTAETDPSIRYDGYATSNIQADPNWIIPTPTSRRSYSKRTRGLYRAQGPIDLPVSPENIIGDLMMAVFGAEGTPANPETGVYTHTFTPADTIPSYTVRIGVEQTERVLPGCLVESLQLKWKAGDVVRANAMIYSGFPETTDDIVASPTLDSLQWLTQIDDLVNITIDGDATRASVVCDLDVTIKNNIPFNTGDLSGRNFNDIEVGVRDVTGNVTLKFEDTTDFDNFKNSASFDLIIAVASSLIGDSETYYHTLGLNLYNLQILRSGAPPLRAQNETLKISAPFRAFYDSSEELEIEGLLRNSISAY